MPNPRIFLSYTEEERTFVRLVAEALLERGVDTFGDLEAVDPGQRFSEQLREALRFSSALVAFLGKAPDSPWLLFEIGAAFGASKTVLPIYLSADARDNAPPLVRDVNGIDAANLKPEEVADGIADALAAGA